MFAASIWGLLPVAAIQIVLLMALGCLIDSERRLIGKPPTPRSRKWIRLVLAAPVLWLLAWGLQVLTFQHQGLETPEVQPGAFGLQARFYYHCCLLTLIALATIIDFDCLVIPDAITATGSLIALGVATAIGDVQLVHLWVDWTVAIPGLRGPTIPDWYSTWPRLHGLSCSLAGLLAGGGLTAIVRWGAGRVFGQQAMGFGDVTFMAMIGAFLGWQAIVLSFLAAPVVGLVFVLPLRWLLNIPYVPYGPFLGTGAIVVLFNWAWLWRLTRELFSDPVALLILGGVAAIAFVVLTGGIVLYRRIPTRRASSPAKPESASES